MLELTYYQNNEKLKKTIKSLHYTFNISVANLSRPLLHSRTKENNLETATPSPTLLASLPPFLPPSLPPFPTRLPPLKLLDCNLGRLKELKLHISVVILEDLKSLKYTFEIGQRSCT